MGALLIAGLSFGYDDALLFEDLDLSFPEGGLTGIVGKNGTGKSTLCDIVAGIHAAEVQFCEWRGQSLHLADFAQLVAYASQEPEFFPALTGIENLELLGLLLEQPDGYVARTAELAGLLGISPEDLRRKQSGNYSGGMREKLWLVAQLGTDREFLILDEPFESLDSDSVDVLVGILNEDQRSGILVSHVVPASLELVDVIELVGAEE